MQSKYLTNLTLLRQGSAYLQTARIEGNQSTVVIIDVSVYVIQSYVGTCNTLVIIIFIIYFAS